jgi:hypothetical protein
MEDMMPLGKTSVSYHLSDDNHFDELDPYVVFDGPVYDSTPRNFIQYIDTVRKESEWRSLGFTLKKDSNGKYKPIIKNGLYFSFRQKIRFSTTDIEAIASGKRITQDPVSVLALVLQGCKYDEFVSLPLDIINYCEYQKSLNQEDFENALSYIKKAFEAKSDEVRYASSYYEVRLILGDKSAIDEELTFFQDDIDCLVHSERVYKWLKYLSSIKDYVSLDKTVKAIDRQLEALIAGQAMNRRYTTQRVEFYIHEKEQFMKKTNHLRKRIEAALVKQQNSEVR